MKRNKGTLPKIISIALIVSLLMVVVSGIAVATDTKPSVITSTPKGESIHDKIDISQITGEIAEPPQLTSAASSVATEKEWYEYVYYAKEPVGHYYFSDNTRLTFYDPYDYSNSLIMEVNDGITDWSSMNQLQVSYTTSNSLTDTTGRSVNTTSSVEVAEGDDVATSTGGDSTVTTTVKGKVYSYNYSKTEEATDSTDEWSSSSGSSSDFSFLIEASVGVDSTYVKDSDQWTVSESSEYTDGGSTTTVGERKTTDDGWTEDKTTTTAKTEGEDTVVTTVIADRLTNATGSEVTSTISMSTENSTTITKTYDAAYFNASGSPLQWKVIQYTVKMPMKIQVEYLVDDEWIFGDYSYCLLNTIQGTCRAWMQNNVAYYEHWGTGEPVTWDEFWSQFFTEEKLISAYQNKLYPDA